MYIKEVTKNILEYQLKSLNAEEDILDSLTKEYNLGEKEYKFYYTQKLQIYTSKEQIRKTLKDMEETKCVKN